jgi:hypothetical protein
MTSQETVDAHQQIEDWSGSFYEIEKATVEE